MILCCVAASACDGASSGDLPLDEPGASSAGAPTLEQAAEPTLPGIGDGELGGRGPGSPGGPRDAGIASGPTGSWGGATDGVVGARPATPPASSGATTGRSAGPSVGAPSSGVSRPSSGGSDSVAAADGPGGAALPPTKPGVPILPPRDGGITPRPGTLTAGTWDDNRNFAFFDKYRAAISQQLSGVLPFEDRDFERAHAQSLQPQGARSRLDVALVIDTTGSMGDEIRYLQSEFVAISRAIEAAYPQSEQRWALVTYRDEGDEYVARYFDFRTEPEQFRQKLSAQSAGGGGDFPEAPQAAFAILNQFAWRTSRDVAKLAFWVADAPHHPQFAGALAKSVRDARDLGIHVYPVASSGVDELTELTMRSTAQITLGRYIFLTDDSRVGNDHKEPTIPCYFVTKLDDALLRAVSYEMTGVYREPDPQQILRIQGNPQRGTCSLGGGQNVQAW